MQTFEYSVIAAPARGEKVRGAKTSGERYAAALARMLNAMAAEGWDYVRAETLPSEERSGLTSRTTVWTNVLVFRRPLPGAAAAAVSPPAQAAAAPEPAPAPIEPAPVAGPPPLPEPRPMPPAPAPAAAPVRVFSEPMRLTDPAPPPRAG